MLELRIKNKFCNMFDLIKIGLPARVNYFEITVLIIPETDSFIVLSIKRYAQRFSLGIWY